MYPFFKGAKLWIIHKIEKETGTPLPFPVLIKCFLLVDSLDGFNGAVLVEGQFADLEAAEPRLAA